MGAYVCFQGFIVGFSPILITNWEGKFTRPHRSTGSGLGASLVAMSVTSDTRVRGRLSGL